MTQSESSPRGKMNCETAQRAIALAAMSATEYASEQATDPFATHLEDMDNEQAERLLASLDEDEPEPLFAHGETDSPQLSSQECLDRFLAECQATQRNVASIASCKQAVQSPKTQALAEHLSECPDCQAEMTSTAKFFRALASEPGSEPSAALLAQARMRLDAELDECPITGFWSNLLQQFFFLVGRLRTAPAFSSLLLLIGVIAGAYGGYQAGISAHTSEQTALLLSPPTPPEVPSVVADVNAISRDPRTGMVQVRYDRLVPDTLTASPDTPSMRELLTAAAQNGVSPQVRDTSVNLLSRTCQDSAPCADNTPVRTALLNALATDKTPQVRREALAGLQPYIAEDTAVRDAVLTALINDPSAAVRIEAVRLLQPVEVDSSVRQALSTAASSDGDPLIRSASMHVLKTSPAVQ